MRSVTVRTPSQAFERMLSVRSDTSRLLGKTVVSTTATNPIGLDVNTHLLGARPVAFAAIFLRWKINRLIVKPLFLNLTGQGSFAGFLDDNISSGDVPTTGSGVLDLRCSVAYPANESAYETHNEFEWSPLRGPTKWFYTTLEGSTSDPRLEVPCSFWYGQTATATIGSWEVDYDISFEGAVDTLST